MPRVKAFRALRPNPDSVSQIASVPYDVVNREEAAALASGNPDSFLHVIRPEIDLPANADPYTNAVYQKGHDNLRRLISAGLLKQEDHASLFAYRQIMDGRSQTGIVCCCHIDDYENNLILKHEKTRKAKEDDRTQHMLALGAHPGPVFLTYRDLDAVNQAVAEAMTFSPTYDFTAEDGIRHTVWQIDETDNLTDLLSAAPVFYIADGHHRAASAWRAGKFRRDDNSNHTGDEEYNWFLTVLFPQSQLKILSYNRVLRDMNKLSAEQLKSELGKIGTLTRAVSPVPERPGSFCLLIDGTWWLLVIPSDSIDHSDAIASLDVAILEDRVLAPLFGIQDVRTDARIDFVGGIRGTEELERLVGSGQWSVAVSMYPTSIQQLMAVADAGQIMPPKSTWFEPKLRSGLLVHLMD
jgi:uncharacterized protein (DUF1015 family)